MLKNASNLLRWLTLTSSLGPDILEIPGIYTVPKIDFTDKDIENAVTNGRGYKDIRDLIKFYFAQGIDPHGQTPVHDTGLGLQYHLGCLAFDTALYSGNERAESIEKDLATLAHLGIFANIFGNLENLTNAEEVWDAVQKQETQVQNPRHTLPTFVRPATLTLAEYTAPA